MRRLHSGAAAESGGVIMKNCENGTYTYINKLATISVPFPVDCWGEVYDSCKYCRFSRYGKINECLLIGKPILINETFISADCPLKQGG